VVANSTPLALACTNLELTWSINPLWTVNPGFGPNWYEISRNGTPAATVTSDYPNDVTWASGDTLLTGGIIKYDIDALFSGPLRSALLSLHFQCNLGNLVEITATP
jgi:hypothetical protein